MIKRLTEIQTDSLLSMFFNKGALVNVWDKGIGLLSRRKSTNKELNKCKKGGTPYLSPCTGRLFLDTFIGLSTPKDPEKGYGYIYKDSWEKLVEQFSTVDDPVVKNEIDLDEYLDTSLLEKINEF